MLTSIHALHAAPGADVRRRTGLRAIAALQRDDQPDHVHESVSCRLPSARGNRRGRTAQADDPSVRCCGHASLGVKPWRERGSRGARGEGIGVDSPHEASHGARVPVERETVVHEKRSLHVPMEDEENRDILNGKQHAVGLMEKYSCRTQFFFCWQEVIFQKIVDNIRNRQTFTSLHFSNDESSIGKYVLKQVNRGFGKGFPRKLNALPSRLV